MDVQREPERAVATHDRAGERPQPTEQRRELTSTSSVAPSRSAISGYTASASATGNATRTCTTTGTTSCTIKGLTSGTAYDVSVTATSGGGTSVPSTATKATPN